MEGVKIYHAGTKQSEGKIVSTGGRVLAVTGLGPNLREALKRSYEAVSKVSFDEPDAKRVSMHHRTDIGHRALAAESA